MACTRSPRSALPLALGVLLALPACNAIFGVEAGELAGGEGGAGQGGGASSSGGGPHSGGGGPGGGGSTGVGGACGDPATGPLTGALRWAEKSTSSTYALATSLAYGTHGDIFVAGAYDHGAIQFDAISTPHAGDAYTDVFLASYDAVTGKPRWGKGFPGLDEQQIFSVATDPTNGDVLVAGWFAGSFSLDGGVTTLATVGNFDAFVARFSKDGAHLWTKVYANLEDQFGVKVAVDAGGHVMLAMQGFGELTFADATRGDTDGSAGLYVVKLDPTGAEQWSRYWRGTFYNGLNIGLAFDAEGHIVIAGSGGDESFQSPDPFHGGTDIFVMKYDAAGTYVWSRMFGSSMPNRNNGDQWATTIATDCAGDVYIAGGFQVDLELGALPVLPASPDDGQYDFDVFIAKLGGDDGEPVWARAFVDAGYQIANAVSVDASLHVVLSGLLTDTAASSGIDFGGGTKLEGAGPDGADFHEDLFVVKLAGDGAHTWSRRIGDPFIQRGAAALGPAGEIAVAGDFFHTILIEPTTDGELMDTERDLFVAAFDP